MTTDKPEERKPNKIYQNVKEWLDDIEVYSSRRERLHAELLDIDGNLDFYQVNRWLKAAWECGQEQAREQALREAAQIAICIYQEIKENDEVSRNCRSIAMHIKEQINSLRKNKT